MSQYQCDSLRMLGVEQLAQLLRIGALQLGQIAMCSLLGASSSVSRCTSASGRARSISLASSSPTATSRIAALRTPLRLAAARRRAASF